MDSILRDTAGTVVIELRNSDGTLVNATGAVAVVVKDPSGATVQSGNATNDSTGVYSYIITPTTTATLDLYDVTWTGTLSGQPFTMLTAFEVVGANVFTIADLRTFSKSLVDTTRYPADLLREAREAALERFERAFRRGTRPRAKRWITSGTGKTTLLLPDQDVLSVRSLTIDSVAVTDYVLDPDTGELTRDSGFTVGDRNVTVVYEYGAEQVPADVVRALKMLAVEYAVPNTVPSRATGVTTETGTVRYTLAGRDGATGIPDVDAIGYEWGHARPMVG